MSFLGPLLSGLGKVGKFVGSGIKTGVKDIFHPDATEFGDAGIGVDGGALAKTPPFVPTEAGIDPGGITPKPLLSLPKPPGDSGSMLGDILGRSSGSPYVPGINATAIAPPKTPTEDALPGLGITPKSPIDLNLPPPATAASAPATYDTAVAGSKYDWGGDPVKSAEYDARYGKGRREQGLSEEEQNHPGAKARLLQALKSSLTGAAEGYKTGGLGGAIGGAMAGAAGGAINPAEGRGFDFKILEEPKLLADEARGNQRLKEQIGQEAAQAQVQHTQAATDNIQQDNKRADKAEQRAEEEWGVNKQIKEHTLKQHQQQDQINNQIQQLELEMMKETNPLKVEMMKEQILHLKAQSDLYSAQAAQKRTEASQPKELSAADERNLREMSEALAQQAYTPDESSKAIQSYTQQAYKNRGITDADLAKARDATDPLGAKQAQARIDDARASAEREGTAMHQAERSRLSTVIQQELRERQGQMPTPGTPVTERQLEVYRQRRGLRSLDEAKRVATVLGYRVVPDQQSEQSPGMTFRGAMKGQAGGTDYSQQQKDAMVEESLKKKK